MLPNHQGLNIRYEGDVGSMAASVHMERCTILTEM